MNNINVMVKKDVIGFYGTKVVGCYFIKKTDEIIVHKDDCGVDYNSLSDKEKRLLKCAVHIFENGINNVAGSFEFNNICGFELRRKIYNCKYYLNGLYGKFEGGKQNEQYN